MKTVSAAEANRQFSKLLREVEAGETVVVTSHGRNVAKISPMEEDAAVRSRRSNALREHLARLREKPSQPVETWTRAELYEDEPYPDMFK